MKERLRQWLKRFVDKAKEKWLLWVLFIPFALVEDRVTSFLNRKIDEHSAELMPWLKASFMWIQDSPLGIVGLAFVTVILVLVIHAYWETRPSRVLATGDKVGIPTIIQHPPPPLQKDRAEKLHDKEYIRSKPVSDREREDTGFEFFPTIDDLRRRHPLPETFKPGNEIHACFLSGEGVFAEHNDYVKYVKRLILPNPDATNISTLQTLSNSYVDFRAQITKTRVLAKKNNIPVRLFQDFIGVSLLFCNPDRPDGWVQIGTIIPGAESSERQHYKLYKAKHEQAVRSLYNTFERLWGASIEQTEDEAFEEGFAAESRALSPSAKQPVPLQKLEITFSQDYCETIAESDHLQRFDGNRTRYWVKVKNSGSEDILTMIRLVKFELLPTNPTDMPMPISLPQANPPEYPPLPFKRTNEFRMNLVPNTEGEAVYVVSSNERHDYLRIEGRNIDCPHHYENSYRLGIAGFVGNKALACADLIVRRGKNKRLDVQLERVYDAMRA